jgi:hypothetical protein
MKNTITFLLVVFFHCLVSAQLSLVGTWTTEDDKTLKIDSLLTGTYGNRSEGRTLHLIANELPNLVTNATAVSMSLIHAKEGKSLVTSTMTGQIYQKEGNAILEVFHVLQTGGSLSSGETLFFKKIRKTFAPITPPTLSSMASNDSFIGSWHDGGGIASLNIVYIEDQKIYATYRHVPEGYHTGILIKLKGFFSRSDDANFIFSLSGISPLFKDAVNEPFTISLSGVITQNETSYHCSSSINLAHAYGAGVTYSAVRSEGGYYTKPINSSNTYKILENTLEALNFTNNGATNWVSNIAIGEQGTQSLRMALDTGGNFDWVNSSQCQTNVCTEGHTQFDTIQSSTFRWIDKVPKTKDWGPWGTTLANLGFDAMNLQPTDLDTGAFKELNLITSFDDTAQFRELLWDGALAVPAYSSGGNPYDIKAKIDNIILDLVTNGVIDPNKVFVSFNYDEDEARSQYIIGSDVVNANEVDLDSKITLTQEDYQPVPYLWATSLKSVKVGGNEVSGIASNVTRFSFDTGASALKGDTDKMNEVLNLIGVGSPDIEYNMGVDSDGNDGRFVLTSNQYRRTIEQGEDAGTQQVQVQPLDGLPNLWLQGTTLLEDLHSVFKYRVSFNTKGDLVLNAQEVNLYNKKNGPKIIQKPLCQQIISSFPNTEGFESAESLSWTQSDEDDIDWAHRSGDSPSSNTGPSNAFEGNYYYYVGGSFFNYKNIEAILESPCFAVNNLNELYFNFNYYMYSSDSDIIDLTIPSFRNDMVSLTLQMSSDGNQWDDLWSKSGNQGSQWASESIEVPLSGQNLENIKFRFVGITGNSDTSDMAIDGIEVTLTPTPAPCAEEFTDNEGTFGNYSNSQNETWTYHPNEAGQKVEAVFNYIETEQNYDYLYVYDGPDTSSTLIQTFNGHHPGVVSFVSTHSSGALTVKFTSDGSVTLRGWEATINRCVNLVSRSLNKEVIVKQEQEQEQEQEHLSNEIRIYPNPFASSLQIMVPSSEKTSGDSSVSITNVLGKVLERYTYKASQHSLKINLSHLSKGVYFVRIYNSEGETVKKILKLDK